MRKVIDRIRRKSPEEKRRFAIIVSVALTAMIACIAFLSIVWDLERRSQLAETKAPVSVQQNLMTEIKDSLKQIKERASANVSEVEKAF
jgi:large-conductance mechanosensitive channel